MASSSPFDGMTPTERAERIAELMKASEKLETFNRYLKYDPYDKQRQFHAKSAAYNLILLMGGNQLGKALKNGTKVLTPTGWVAIDRLKVGDLVIAGDGTPTTVTGVYPQGVKNLYNLTFNQS